MTNVRDYTSMGTKEKLSTAASDLGDRLQQMPGFDKMRGASENLLNRGKEMVSQDPWRIMFVAFALGLLFGRRSRPRMTTLKHEYVDVAVDRTRTGMFAMFLALATMFRRLFRSASRTTSDTWYSARRYSKPWIKSARRTGRKMHLFR